MEEFRCKAEHTVNFINLLSLLNSNIIILMEVNYMTKTKSTGRNPKSLLVIGFVFASVILTGGIVAASTVGALYNHDKSVLTVAGDFDACYASRTEFGKPNTPLIMKATSL